jgi:hypothetical protein
MNSLRFDLKNSYRHDFGFTTTAGSQEIHKNKDNEKYDIDGGFFPVFCDSLYARKPCTLRHPS